MKRSAMSRRSRRLALLGPFLLAAALPGEMNQPWIGKPAPAFNLSTLDGRRLALSDLKGKFVVLHFGTGW